MTVRGLVPWLVGAALLAGAELLAAQQTYNPRDDQFRTLGLVRAQAELERAQSRLERAEQLHERDLISTEELDDHRLGFERARVDYLQQALALVSASAHVAVERAVKRRAPNGQSEVRVTLRNTTSGGDQGVLRGMLSRDELARLDPSGLSNVHVSLKTDAGAAGTIVSQPYERRIASLPADRAVAVDFRLLQELDEVVVSVLFGDRSIERRVHLEMDATAEMVGVQSVQFSQEADLGGQATYDLRLERFTSSDNAVRLAVFGLPREVRHEFRDPDTGARLNQVRFPAGATRRNLQLVLSLPQRASESLRMDEPIGFWLLALDDASGEEVVRRLEAGEARVEEVEAGKSRLELLPRGTGRIQVRATNLYHEIRPTDRLEMEVSVRNAGTRVLEDVRLRLEAPSGWEVEVDPASIAELPLNAEQRVRLSITPPRGVVRGDYEVRLRTESDAADRRLEVDDRTIRIHVASAGGWWTTGALSVLLLGLVAGVVFAGYRLARR